MREISLRLHWHKAHMQCGIWTLLLWLIWSGCFKARLHWRFLLRFQVRSFLLTWWRHEIVSVNNMWFKYNLSATSTVTSCKPFDHDRNLSHLAAIFKKNVNKLRLYNARTAGFVQEKWRKIKKSKKNIKNLGNWRRKKCW
jgi:hypothetical protein